MNIQITQVSMTYGNREVTEVQVFFIGNDDNHTINLNGHIPLSAEEYAGNESPSVLENLVRQKLSDRILNPPPIEEDPEA